MSYRFRNFLFFIFFIVFLVLTTVFSLYASGYKISFYSIIKGQALIQKTGILAVDSLPKGADVFITRQSKGLFFDDEINKNKKIKTPYKIKNLLPGEYILTLSLDGYWPWQQKFYIYPGQSTYMEDIILFKDDLPVNFFNSTIQDIKFNSGAQKIILNNEKKLLDLKSGQEIYLGEKINDLSFLDSKRVLLNNSLIFDYLKNKYIDLSSLSENNLVQPKIKGDNLFYINNGLQKYSLFLERKETIFSLENIIDYDFYNGFYFLIIKEENKVSFKTYSYRDKELIKEIDLPLSDKYQIINPGASAFVYIYNEDFRNFYIINVSSKFNSYWSVVNNVDGFDFIDANNFIYFSDFEIYSFNSILAEKFLLGRFEEPIKSLIWHPKNYVIYSTNKDIVILDLKYDKYFIKIVSLESVANIVFDKSNSVLYFSGEKEGQSGLFRLFIQ
jgi:hypothetical protein